MRCGAVAKLWKADIDCSGRDGSLTASALPRAPEAHCRIHGRGEKRFIHRRTPLMRFSDVPCAVSHLQRCEEVLLVELPVYCGWRCQDHADSSVPCKQTFSSPWIYLCQHYYVATATAPSSFGPVESNDAQTQLCLDPKQMP
ncbi:hypothetical protein EYF80_042369 [Liparis tanakae]|uniref:Uncharacterized protein n=1 Tax=Liparis tanakae TaxID=230148 RepID=A0A4Z2G1K0_9TELE|nr:hypothetical protein EYF80_042369 [Liparis tanakae]